MTGKLQPLDEKFPIVTPDGRPTTYFIRWAQQRQIDIGKAITAQQALQIVVQTLTENPLIEGTGIDLSPSGNILDGVTISADTQEILDAISSTHGSVLFRGAADWQALAPGTLGHILATGGAGADPSWIAPPSANIRIEDEGGTVVAAATALNFAGAGVTVTDAGGNEALVTIPGGGGGGSSYLGQGSFSPGVDRSITAGNFLGQFVVVDRAFTIANVETWARNTVATTRLTPGVYACDTAGNPTTLLASGPTVVGVVPGQVTLPLTTPLAVTRGQRIYIGYNVRVANFNSALSWERGMMFFAVTVDPPPTPAPAANVGSQTTWPPIWASSA